MTKSQDQSQEALRKRLEEWRKVKGKTAPIQRHNTYANANKAEVGFTLEQAQEAAQGGNAKKARQIFKRVTEAQGSVSVWLEWSHWEAQWKDYLRSREYLKKAEELCTCSEEKALVRNWKLQQNSIKSRIPLSINKPAKLAASKNALLGNQESKIVKPSVVKVMSAKKDSVEKDSDDQDSYGSPLDRLTLRSSSSTSLHAKSQKTHFLVDSPLVLKFGGAQRVSLGNPLRAASLTPKSPQYDSDSCDSSLHNNLEFSSVDSDDRHLPHRDSITSLGSSDSFSPGPVDSLKLRKSFRRVSTPAFQRQSSNLSDETFEIQENIKAIDSLKIRKAISRTSLIGDSKLSSPASTRPLGAPRRLSVSSKMGPTPRKLGPPLRLNSSKEPDENEDPTEKFGKMLQGLKISASPPKQTIEQPNGSSVYVLTPVRAKKKEKTELGVKSVITPVRRSIRHLKSSDWFKEGEDVKDLLESAGYAFVPNKNLSLKKGDLLRSNVKKRGFGPPNS